MKNKNIRNTVIGITVMVLLIGAIGISYAYYAMTIKGNTKNKTLNLRTENLQVTFLDGIQFMSFDSGYFFPGDSKTKRFNVANTGEKDAYYTVLIDNVKNEFERTQDLKYELYINEELKATGNITNEEEQYLYYNQSIEKNKVDDIRFVLKYATTTESQNVDMNKDLSFRFNISDKLED